MGKDINNIPRKIVVERDSLISYKDCKMLMRWIGKSYLSFGKEQKRKFADFIEAYLDCFDRTIHFNRKTGRFELMK